MTRGLAAMDAAAGGKTSVLTDRALRYLLREIQADDGSIEARYRFPPINSDTRHATVAAAMAIRMAPGWFDRLQDPNVRSRVHKLLNYLKSNSPQHDHQRLQLLWASTFWSDLLAAEDRDRVIRQFWKLQRPDGGWSIRSFASPAELGGGAKARELAGEPGFDDPVSDGYQTAFTIVVIRDSGIPAADPRLQKAVSWLKRNQRESGRWWTKSLNTTSRFHYVSFSGTAYAALALSKFGELTAADDVE